MKTLQIVAPLQSYGDEQQFAKSSNLATAEFGDMTMKQFWPKFHTISMEAGIVALSSL
jgi:hypothetical protein